MWSERITGATDEGPLGSIVALNEFGCTNSTAAKRKPHAIPISRYAQTAALIMSSVTLRTENKRETSATTVTSRKRADSTVANSSTVQLKVNARASRATKVGTISTVAITK